MKLIASVDHDPHYTILRRDGGHDLEDEPPVGPIVICSMPGIWYHLNDDGSENSTRTHHSWERYLDWIGKGRRVLFAGIGTCLPYHLKTPLTGAIKECFDEVNERLLKEAMVYCRSDVANRILEEHMPTHTCPSIFACDKSQDRSLKVCNLMPHGAHHPFFEEKESAAWKEKLPVMNQMFLDSDFLFMAHSLAEIRFAHTLGWPDHRIIKGKDPMVSMDTYSMCKTYIGNRVHGAIVSASVGATSYCIGYDSRVHAAEIVGAKAILPSELSLSDINQWPETQRKINLQEQFETQRKYFLWT